MEKFDLVAMGGTFDIIHKGHRKLLSRAFGISRMVIIGLTSDEFAGKRGKDTLHDYRQRHDALEGFIRGNMDGRFRIDKLDTDFGPAAIEDIQALVVSEETRTQGAVLNALRAERNIAPVEIIVVPMEQAAGGGVISTTRIRNSEIDPEGNLVDKQDNFL